MSDRIGMRYRGSRTAILFQVSFSDPADEIFFERSSVDRSTTR